MNIYKSTGKRPIITRLYFIAVIIFGIASCTKSSSIPIPDTKAKAKNNTLMVITRYPGASASEIENNVTRPLENILYSVGHLKHISSQSRANISLITLEFENGYDISDLTNDVRDKLNMAKEMLPIDAETPFIFKPSDTVIMLSVKAEESIPALYKILKDNIANPLACIRGVTNVSIIGAPKREINVYMDPYKMAAYNISVEAVSSAIAAENRNFSGGNFDIGSNTNALRVEGEFKTPTDMMNIVLRKSYYGDIIRLGDVARLVDGFDERAPKTFIDGQQGAMIIIELQSGGNSTHITNAIKEMLPELQKRLPSDIETSFFASLLRSPSFKSEFLPSPNNNCISTTLELPSTRVEIAEEIGMQLTNLWKERYGNAISSCIFTIGQADEENYLTSLSPNGSHINFYLRFAPDTELSKSLGVICDEMRADIRMNPEIARSKVSIDGESKASFEIYGYDFAVTDSLSKELARYLEKSPLISQVNISRSDYQPEYQVDFDREKLAMHGLNLSTAATLLRNCFNGAMSTYFREDGDEYKVKVRYAPEFRNDISTIENIELTAPTGAKIRVRDVAQIKQSDTPPTIERKDRSRIVTVDAVMAAGAALSEGVAYGMSVVDEMTIPSGYKIQVTTSY